MSIPGVGGSSQESCKLAWGERGAGQRRHPGTSAPRQVVEGHGEAGRPGAGVMGERQPPALPV